MSPTQACLGAEAPHRDVPAADVCDLLNSPMKVATHFPTSESTKWPLSLGRAPQPPSSPFGPQHLLLALAPWKLLELLTVPFSHTLCCTHQQILGLNCNILLEPLINYVRGFLQGPKHLGSKVLPPESPCGSPTLSHLPLLDRTPHSAIGGLSWLAPVLLTVMSSWPPDSCPASCLPASLSPLRSHFPVFKMLAAT